MKYRSGYKYQLAETEDFRLDVLPDEDIHTDFIHLLENGHMVIEKGYAWDGPSGPTIDTLNFMRGSLVHDALYQLMRGNHLPEGLREIADDELKKICREYGMSGVRAWGGHKGVRWFAKTAASKR